MACEPGLSLPLDQCGRCRGDGRMLPRYRLASTPPTRITPTTIMDWLSTPAMTARAIEPLM